MRANLSWPAAMFDLEQFAAQFGAVGIQVRAVVCGCATLCAPRCSTVEFRGCTLLLTPLPRLREGLCPVSPVRARRRVAVSQSAGDCRRVSLRRILVLIGLCRDYGHPLRGWLCWRGSGRCAPGIECGFAGTASSTPTRGTRTSRPQKLGVRSSRPLPAGGHGCAFPGRRRNGPSGHRSDTPAARSATPPTSATKACYDCTYSHSSATPAWTRST